MSDTVDGWRAAATGLHLVYVAGDGVEDLRRLLRLRPEYADLLSALETVDRGRTVLADEGSGEGA